MEKSADRLLVPKVPRTSKAWKIIRRCSRELMDIVPQSNRAIEETRVSSLADTSVCGSYSQCSRVVVSVLCDLRAQGWGFSSRPSGILLQRFEPTDRDQVRKAHAVGRTQQLRKPSVRSFIREMERRRLGPNGWVSIFSLMRDGRELAERLATVASKDSSLEVNSLRKVIDPYIQLVSDGATCEHTGFRLLDIWRYFRHTWSTEYASVPGRTMMVLVRDAASDCHPVLGIAALASPVVHLTNRDQWLGWTSKEFIEQIRKEPTREWAKWVHTSLSRLISEIYREDFLSEKIISSADIRSPTRKTLARLRKIAHAARANHRRYPMAALHKNPTSALSKAEWRQRAETYLFRWKRASVLADLLETRLQLNEIDFGSASVRGLKAALSHSGGRRALDMIRRWTKARHIGNDVLDIMVCGAVPPYGELLGGKLVAMLLASPEVVRAYSKRYGEIPSIIASSIAGRPIKRRPQLVVLTTTSLYGGGLNQYTRISIPARIGGGPSEENVRFERLGETEGKGSFHFSRITLDEMSVLLRQQESGPKIHSIFGEGVNPRLRKIRTALELAGFPPDLVITHGSSRDMYGVRLASNTTEYLLGRATTPNYFLKHDNVEGVTRAIVEHWMTRWLAPRLLRKETIDRMSAHTLVQPIKHGARVVLPRRDEEESLFLFSDDEPE